MDAMAITKSDIGSSTTNKKTINVMMFPFLAFGHISPFVQLAQKLVAVSDNTVRISLLIANGNVPRVKALLPSTPSISIIPLHLPQVAGLPPGAESTAEVSPAGAELLKIALDGTKPQVDQILREMRADVIIFDFAQIWVPSLAKPLGIKSVQFCVFAAFPSSYLCAASRKLHGPNPTLEDMMKPPLGFPSSSPIQSVPPYMASDFLYIFKSFNGQPCVYDRVTRCLEECDGIIFKTCNEMEGKYIDFFKSQHGLKLLLAGPVVPEPPQGKLERKWADWLEGFPEGSVVFSSFGSETFLSEANTKELLLGLEMSGFPFLVVLNFSKNGEETNEAMVKKILPEGFKERIKGRGIVHCGWVQQQHILRHKSVGCFVCHAGFSSVAEGMISDCQLVMLPQKGDQFLNSLLFVKELGIGVEVERNEVDGSFNGNAVCEGVRMVMDGDEFEGKKNPIRENHKKWKEFLMDEKVQGSFMVEFVRGLKDLVSS
ncbi:hypothetical protein LUZ60_007995 [Juncus effusus]|nr:hypothetical protein LUZ60_007995 [Juncus effusus]